MLYTATEFENGDRSIVDDEGGTHWTVLALRGRPFTFHCCHCNTTECAHAEAAHNDALDDAREREAAERKQRNAYR